MSDDLSAEEERQVEADREGARADLEVARAAHWTALTTWEKAGCPDAGRVDVEAAEKAVWSAWGRVDDLSRRLHPDPCWMWDTPLSYRSSEEKAAHDAWDRDLVLGDPEADIRRQVRLRMSG